MIKKPIPRAWPVLFISLFLIGSLSVITEGQQTADFNKRELSIIHLGAIEVLNGYESLINQIGESTVNNPSLTKGLSDQFLELFVSRQVMLFNDLDPDHKLSPFYESETYINNLLLWYPDGMDINLNLDNARAGDILNHGNDVYSLDFKIEKQISGNYMNQRLNLNAENLLYRVAFNEAGGDFRNFRIVGIRNIESDMVPDYDRSLEEVASQDLKESEAYTIRQGIEALINDYSNYLLLLGNVDESEEDKGLYAESFRALFESPDITVFNDLTPNPQDYLISIDAYLDVLSAHYPAGINNLSVTMDSTVFENVISEQDEVYSTYINLAKFFSGMYDNQEVFRNMFPLTLRVSFKRSGRAYEEFRIRSIDLEAEDLFDAEVAYVEPDNKITPVSRNGFSLTVFGSYGQTRIEDHNLTDLNLESDKHTWSFSPGFGINAGAGIMYSINDHLALEFGGFFNQWLLGIEEGSWTETLENGKLFFQSHTDKPKEDLIPVFIDTERDFEIETVIQFSGGDMTKAFGLQWGKSKTQSKQYDFFIAANGQYTIDKYDGGFEDYIPFTHSEYVNRYAPNKLTFRKVTDSSYFFLNEQLVHRMPFQSFFGNLTGIQVSENSTILADYFKVVYLDKAENLLSKVLIIDYTHTATDNSLIRGMPIKLTVQVKNAGRKDAQNLDITYRLPADVEVVNFRNIRHINASETKELVLEFFPTGNFKENQIRVEFDIDGADITNAEDVDFVIHLDDPGKASHDKSLVQTYSEYRGDDPLKGLNVAQALRAVEIGDYYALIIGIDKFRGEWPPLRNAVNDARTIQGLLEEKYQFHHIKSLYNEEATRQNILGAFEWFMQNLNKKDNLLIYYSGHGYYNEQMEKGFWVPVDAETKQIHQYISNEEIRAFMSGIPTRHTLLVSDACFSGDIFRGKTLSIPYENSTKYYHKVYSLMSRKALTSGGIEPVLDGGRDGHSVFGYYLLKSLENNNSKYLDAGELYNQIRIPVINNSEQTPIYNPVNDTGDEGGQFIFITK